MFHYSQVHVFHIGKHKQDRLCCGLFFDANSQSGILLLEDDLLLDRYLLRN
ncbi:hypothetical protein GT2_16_00500 [Parageobacillus thermoglucosidasius NBRC 107763]|nr:hypothetical protein Geoth_2910 [Parageobacillus thermoglucosidasius C56-YS93]KYD15023.1 hypothetical protein B4168_2232 [Anoxybacillus flavithermus]OAO85887.1 hypothetical protein GT23_2790 [Parageobacillus thermoglucosidasius]GAJ44298.1 hypothetical protein GT2_16_00500 [Parageobacillus thermoglucosidasius NBRC 107763]